VHYEPVRYDLADLATRGQQLLAKFNGSGNEPNGTTTMESMAAAAASKAIDTFSFLGQLDSIAYAVQKVCHLDVVFTTITSPKSLAAQRGMPRGQVVE
jgi:hypothetical protein